MPHAQICELILTDDLVEECSNHHTDAYKNDVKRDVMFELILLSFNWSSEKIRFSWSSDGLNFKPHDMGEKIKSKIQVWSKRGKGSFSVSVSDD